MKFCLDGSDGEKWSLEDFKGKYLVLYFYPKDNTPGCSMQAVEFTELKEEFEKLNAVVVGVSRQGLKSHDNFIQKKDLEILLLSDPEEEAHKSFDVLKNKKLYGKTFLGVERSTFVFDPDGELIKEYRKVKASGHAEMVLEDLKKIQAETK